MSGLEALRFRRSSFVNIQTRFSSRVLITLSSHVVLWDVFFLTPGMLIIPGFPLRLKSCVSA